MRSRIFCTFATVFFLLFYCTAYAESLDELKARAESGDGAAQYKYAEELGWNFGGQKMALPWWQKSAEQSYPAAVIALAQNDLSEITNKFPNEIEAKEKEYFAGNCPKIKKAIAEIEKENTAEAFYNLADVYADGICVKADRKKAESLYLKAADMGLGSAQLRLAELMNANGGNAEGVKWLKKAAEHNMVLAKMRLAMLYAEGKGVEKDGQKASALYKEIEDGGTPMGLTALASLYAKGRRGLPQDAEKAKELLKRAAGTGYEPAVKLLKKLQ